MPLDIIQEILNNKFLLILMEEKEYASKLADIIKSVEKTKTGICYVCLSKPYKDVEEDFRERGFKTADFFFIDVLTSHYKKPDPDPRCIFVSSPHDLTQIRVAIRKAVQEKKCSVILFDTISTLLIYQETSSIVKFTHNLVVDDLQENTKKLFIVVKGDSIPKEENQRLVSDLTMFADKALDME
jgi:hypothetical protein